MEDSRIFDEPIPFTGSATGSILVEGVVIDQVPFEEVATEKDELVESLERILETKLSDRQSKILTLIGSLLSDNKGYTRMMNDVSDIIKILRKWK
jgi:hypothetical protein